MGRTIAAWLYLGLSILMLYIVSLELVPAYLVPSDSTSTWYPMLTIQSNQYHMWGVDRLTSYVTLLLNYAAATVSSATISAAFIQACIFYVGSLAVVLSLRPTKGIPRSNILFLSSIPVLLMVFTVGWDEVVLGTFAWLPLLAIVAATLLIMQHKGSSAAAAPVWVFAAFVSLQHAASANQLALLSGIAALVLGYALASRDLIEERVADESLSAPSTDSSPLSKRLALVPLVILLPSLLMTCYFAPVAPFPDYPTTAHLVPDDGIEGSIRPLVGRDYPLPVIDRERVKDGYGSQALLLFSLAAATWLFTRKTLRRRATFVAQAAVVALGVAVLDTLLPEQFAVISPIMSAARLVPWGTTFCLSSVILAAGAWLLGLTLVTNPQRQIGCSILAIAIALMGFDEIQKTPIRREERAFLSHPQLLPTALSPSAAVLLREYRATGVTPEEVVNSALASSSELLSLRTLEPHLESSPARPVKNLLRLLDEKNTTSWSTAGKSQNGSEYLSLSFNTPVRMRALEIDPGKHPTDFPRGLLISANTCSSQGEVLAAHPTWQGALALTQRGFPFYKGQQKVVLAFADNKELSGLCIRQTSLSSFEWSVAELRYLPAR